MGNKYQRTHIHPLTLIRIWKRIRENKDKNRVWIKRDFDLGSHHYTDRHLHTLIKMGLIKKVAGFYYIGKQKIARREIKGYKLKLHIINENEKRKRI